MNTTYIFLSFMLFCFTHLISKTYCAQGYRSQYHEQGLAHPHSYRFGYNTGDQHNPQTRHEVSHSPGHVTGHYSYRDPHGKLHVVHYEAHPKHGFRSHHKKQ